MNTGKFGPELASQPSGVLVPPQEQKVRDEPAKSVVPEAALERSELSEQASFYRDSEQSLNEDQSEMAELNSMVAGMCETLGQQEASAEIVGDKLNSRVNQAKEIVRREETRRQDFNVRLETNLDNRRQIIADWQSHIREYRDGFSEVLSDNHGRASALCNRLCETFENLEATKSERAEIEAKEDHLGPKLPKLKKDAYAAEVRFKQLSPLMDNLVKGRTAELESKGESIKQSGDQFAMNAEWEMLDQYGGLYSARAEEEIRKELFNNEIVLDGYDYSADYLRQYDQARSQHDATARSLAELSGQLKSFEARRANLREKSYELVAQKDELIEKTFNDIVNDHQELQQLHQAIKGKEDELKQHDEQNQAEYKQLIAEAEKLDAPLIEPTDEAVHYGMVERLAAKGIKRDRLPVDLDGLVHRTAEAIEPTTETTGDGIHQELIEAGMQNAPTGVEASQLAVEAIMFKQRLEGGDVDAINSLLRTALTSLNEFDPGEGNHLQLVAKVLTTARDRQARDRAANGDRSNRQEVAQSRVAPDSEQTAKGWIKSSPETVSLGSIRTAGDIAGEEA